MGGGGREGGGSHEGREEERGSKSEQESIRDTDQDLEAVLLCPVIDERRGDKEKEERTERRGHGNGGVKKGQHRGFLPLVRKWSSSGRGTQPEREGNVSHCSI